MEYILQNEFLKVKTGTDGAELHSILAADGTEYLWQADKEHWSDYAPVLFPVIGALRDGTTCSQGTVAMPKHGIVRHTQLEQESADDSQVTYRLVSDSTTKQKYPYDFAFHVKYELKEKTISVTFTTENTGTVALPFCVGGHPGFNIPMQPGEAYGDYTLTFDQKETARCPYVDNFTGEIMDEHCRLILDDSDTITLDHDLFQDDALIFFNLKSRGVTLRSKKCGKGVHVAFDDFPYLGVWSPAKASPFVCIEPWMGCGVCESEDDVLEKKRGAKVLQPGETAHNTFTITIL